MTNASNRHVSPRIVIVLAMTGFAFVVAGRRTRHEEAGDPPPTACPVNPGMTSSPLSGPEASVSVEAESTSALIAMEECEVRDRLKSRELSVAFDEVMARISALMDNASHVAGTIEPRPDPATIGSGPSGRGDAVPLMSAPSSCRPGPWLTEEAVSIEA